MKGAGGSGVILIVVIRYLELFCCSSTMASKNQSSKSLLFLSIPVLTRIQIVTGSSDGSIHVLYSPLTSLKGATLALTRAPKVRAVDDFVNEADRPIMAPHSLPMFKDDVTAGRGGKRRREKDRMDPVKTLRPLPPMNGPGKGGRVGSSADSHVVKGIIGGNTRDEDVSF